MKRIFLTLIALSLGFFIARGLCSVKVGGLSQIVNPPSPFISAGSVIQPNPSKGVKFSFGSTSATALVEISGQAETGDLATSTLSIGSIEVSPAASSTSACIRLVDTDRGGYTYCSSLDGTLSCSTSNVNCF